MPDSGTGFPGAERVTRWMLARQYANGWNTTFIDYLNWSNGQMSCMDIESGGFVLEAVDELNAGDDLGDER